MSGANQGPTITKQVPGGVTTITSSGTGSADAPPPATPQQQKGFFSHKKLDVTFRLGKGDFGEGGFDTVKLTGLRVSASVIKPGAGGMNTMQMRVWGMKLSMMNRLSTLGLQVIGGNLGLGANYVILEAGDDRSNQRSTVFTGTIFNAYADPSGQPDVPFILDASAGADLALKPVAPSSFKGAVDVASAMQTLAGRTNLTFENSGVSGVTVVDPYLPGTAREQIKRLAEMANIEHKIDDNNTLAIWPKGKGRGNVVVIMSPRTGMVGYPTYTSGAIEVVTIYNPQIVYGTRVKVESVLKMAYGEWEVKVMTHTLDSEVASGNWFTRLHLNNLIGAPRLFAT